jgi:ABC-type uncharacterized transport system ATPase subunit
MAVLQFSGVACDKVSNLSFLLEEGEIGILRLASKEDKATILEVAVGEKNPEAGTVTLHERALDAVPGGSIAWLPEHGGLISNLKAWENLTLPSWYHGRRRIAVVEDMLRRWLAALGVAEEDMADLTASPVGGLRTAERKLIGMLRCLLQEPQLMAIDAAIFDGLLPDRQSVWVNVLETFVREAARRAILVVADSEHTLPWKTVKLT